MLNDYKRLCRLISILVEGAVEKTFEKNVEKKFENKFRFFSPHHPPATHECPQKNFSPIGPAGHPFISQKFKGTVVDRTNGGSLEILHTIPFI